ncbi:MAG: HAD hydrolase-like protein [Polyangiaceae bacterium]
MWIQLVVLDVMGTVVEDDDIVTTALAATLLDLGVDADREELRHLAGLRCKLALREVLRRRGLDPSAQAVHAASVRFDERLIVRMRRADPELVHRAIDAITVLRARGCRVALTTSLSGRVLDELLFRVGLRPRRDLDAIVAGDDCVRSRPDPDAIEHAMWSAGVDDSARVCKVGDAVADVREGRAARVGMIVGVASGAATRLELERAGATMVLPSVASLPMLLCGLDPKRRRGGGVPRRVSPPHALRAG